MKICGMKIVINPSLFIFISNQLKICRYSYIVVMPLNSYWIAAEQPLNCRWINFCYWILNISLNAEFSVEWIFVIEYWMFYWMLNFPEEYLLNYRWTNFYHGTLNIPLNVEFPLQFQFFLHIEFFVEHWNLNFKVLLLNIEFPLKIGILPEYWISKYWILKFHWRLHFGWTLNFDHWILNFLKREV